MANRDYITSIKLEEKKVIRRSAQVEHERKVAIFDLLEDNSFSPQVKVEGPFKLRLRIEDNRLIFDVRDNDDKPVDTLALPISGFRKIIKDYFLICDSYFEAIKKKAPSQIEAIDMARRGLHDEGADVLQSRMADHVKMDQQTARRLFTLICVLHIRA